MSTTAAVPPAANEWVVDDIATAALAVLRLGDPDVDAQRVKDAALVACAQVDHAVDHLEPTLPTPSMIDSAVQVTVELYRRKDAPFGTADAWSVDTVPVDIPASPLAGVRSELLPDKERWGLA